MEPYYEDSHVRIYHGDCRDVLPDLDPVETCITDPPYGLSFMGQEWDHEVPDETYWKLVRETVLPGGMLLAFGGTRLWHWLAVGIEGAGWEIRDTLMWLYGQGFPKSLDISKAIDKDAGHWRGRAGEVTTESQPAKGTEYERNPKGEPVTRGAKTWQGWGTAMKPAWEPIILAMNPTDGTFAENALEHGVAGLNIDEARIGTETIEQHRTEMKTWREREGRKDIPESADGSTTSTEGRWPANVVLDEDAAEMLDEQSGYSESRPGVRGGTDAGAMTNRPREGNYTAVNDSGGASRFFYTSKASRADRGPGNNHPTVKPSDLMKWLCTLTSTPDGGTVLDPFMGSGTALLAAKETGRKAVGIELEERWCEVAATRLAQGVLDLGGAA